MDTDTTNLRQFKKKNDKKDVLFDEFNKKRAGREVNKMMWIALGIVAFVLLAAASFIGARLYFTNKAYESVSIVDSTEFFISTGSVVKRFGNYFVVYNSDCINCIDYKGEQIWNEAFQMQKPLTDISDGIIAVADYNGGTIYVMNEKEPLGRIDTGMPIRKFKVASAGYVMAVLDNSSNTPIYVYNTQGEEMLYFNTTMKGYGYPLEIAISDNGILGAVSYLNVDKGSFYSSVGFYNFGKVGQNYQDCLMSSHRYQSALVPEIRFAGINKAVAVADNRLMFYSGDQMPQSNGEILLANKIKSVYEDDKYVALVYDSDDADHKYMAEIYDYDAKLKDKMYFDIDFSDMFFDENRVVLYNSEEIVIHTIGGVDKFVGNYDSAILAMIPTSNLRRFIIVTPDEIQTVEFE